MSVAQGTYVLLVALTVGMEVDGVEGVWEEEGAAGSRGDG